jgi:threonyl-tRNA synthetase
VDDQDVWNLGEHALGELVLPYYSEAGEGAFYGPKIDVQIVDPSGREATLSAALCPRLPPAPVG